MILTIPISLLVTHFVADFMLQSDWMALNKSKRWWPLFLHCLLYALCFGWMGPNFVAVTFITHFLTDAVTSRITSRLWFIRLMLKREDVIDSSELNALYPFHAAVDSGLRHWFFVVIGLDQLIHYVTLALTLRLLA